MQQNGKYITLLIDHSTTLVMTLNGLNTSVQAANGLYVGLSRFDGLLLIVCYQP
jgi:hypothetical protein